MHGMLPKPEQLVDLVGQIGAIQLLMNGAFDERIAQLKAAQAALAETEAVVATLAEANKIFADARADVERAKQSCNDMRQDAEAIRAKAIAREAKVMSRESAASRREQMLEQGTAALNERENNAFIAQQVRTAELSAIEAALREREEAVNKKEQDLSAAYEKLTVDIANFNLRLDALKA